MLVQGKAGRTDGRTEGLVAGMFAGFSFFVVGDCFDGRGMDRVRSVVDTWTDRTDA